MARPLAALGALVLLAAAVLGLAPVHAIGVTCGAVLTGTTDIGAVVATLTGPDPCAAAMSSRTTLVVIAALIGAGLLAVAWFARDTSTTPTGSPGAARTT